MNILSLVMGLLLIFACTFTLSLRKTTISQGVEKTYQAHMNASRKILNSYESMCYERLRGEAKEKKEQTKRDPIASHHSALPNHQNGDCARLNLWPLVVDGIEKHPDLYESAARLLRTFYARAFFNNQPRMEYRLLDAILASAQIANQDPNQSRILLEKLPLKNFNVKPLYSMQSVYYSMLKGTKSVNQGGYPSLLDYFSIENNKNHICLGHASIEMLQALFDPKIAAQIYQELHEQDKEIAISMERIQDICKENGNLSINEEFFQLLEIRPNHSDGSGRKMITKQNEDVCLREKVYFPS